MTVEEITPQQLESEIVRSLDVALVDVRPAAEVRCWKIDTNGLPFINVPEDAVAADAPAAKDAVATFARDGAKVRIICNRGRSSLRAAEALTEQGLECASVSGGMIAWSRLLAPRRLDIGSGTTVIQFMREARGCLSYLVAADRDALVVDPAPAVEPYVAAARSLGARITHVLDTHVHADHLSGARSLAEREGAELHLSSTSLERGIQYAERVRPVEDGDRIEVGTAEICVLALPGHTSDNIGVLLDGRAVICGDSLVSDSVARPDLEVGDERAPEAARTLHDTLHRRILPLRDETILLPCHYPGGRREAPVAPTLAEVKRSVRFLALGRDEFAELSVADLPPRPVNYLNIIAVNLGAESGPDVGGLEVGANSCAARSPADRGVIS
ncbi:MAG: MBL fold metallo-hydrolase [Actinomycetia bacterium]|nr:MBL fold metallo-hydrolase [Actinomycetes bacterium]